MLPISNFQTKPINPSESFGREPINHGNTSTNLPKVKPPAHVKNQPKWLKGRIFAIEKKFLPEQADQVAHCLSYYYLSGDPSLGVNAVRDPNTRATLIKSIFIDSLPNLPEDIKTSLWADIDKKCQWKPKDKSKVRQQAGNIRAGLKARQRVFDACIKFIRRNGTLPSISRLDKLGKCRFEVAKEVRKKIIDLMVQVELSTQTRYPEVLNDNDKQMVQGIQSTPGNFLEKQGELSLDNLSIINKIDTLGIRWSDVLQRSPVRAKSVTSSKQITNPKSSTVSPVRLKVLASSKEDETAKFESEAASEKILSFREQFKKHFPERHQQIKAASELDAKVAAKRSGKKIL